MLTSVLAHGLEKDKKNVRAQWPNTFVELNSLIEQCIPLIKGDFGWLHTRRVAEPPSMSLPSRSQIPRSRRFVPVCLALLHHQQRRRITTLGA